MDTLKFIRERQRMCKSFESSECRGCPTCNYGSEYINEIDITLVPHTIHIKTNQMYEYVLSEGQMIKLFLTDYAKIRTMMEKKFIDWLRAKLTGITYGEDSIEEFEVREVAE